MRCANCGHLLEPGDVFCIGCGSRIESYYVNDSGSTSEPVYYNDNGYDKNRGNSNMSRIIIAVLSIILVGMVAWLLINHFQGKADSQNTPTLVEDQTPPPAETVYVTVPAEETASPSVKTGGYLLPESTSRRMTDADLSQLTHEELCFARNEIYARHGRIFETPQVANYFESKSWYSGTIPANRFDENVFSDIERANVDIIFAYEKKHYGGSYY